MPPLAKKWTPKPPDGSKYLSGPSKNGQIPHGGWETKRRAAAVFEAAAVERRIRGRDGGREYAKPNAAASKTAASDCRARPGGELKALAEGNGAVSATPREEASDGHGGDVFCVVGRVGRSLVWSSVWCWVARSLFLAKIFVKKCANVGFNTFYGTYLKVRKSLVLVGVGSRLCSWFRFEI